MKTGYDQFFRKAKETSQVKKNYAADRFSIKKPDQKKSKFPFSQLLVFIGIAIFGLLSLDNLENIENLFKKIEIGVGVAQAEEKPVQLEAKDAKEAKPVVVVETKAALEAKANDDTDYLFKLAERKKILDEREENLNKIVVEITKQKLEIEEKLKKLEETRQKISTALEEKIKVDDSKVDALVQMYTNMKPQQAAKVFETLDEELVIEILSRMKKKNAAEVLNLIKPEKAQIFAERYAGFRVPASK